MSALDVVATLEAQEGRGDELVAVLQASLATVRAEDGCLRYDLHRVRRRPDEVVMVERWGPARPGRLAPRTLVR